jgi:CheY-like chemotaxis protein
MVTRQTERKRIGGEPALVLLVEDNADHAELIIRSLEEHSLLNRVRHLPDGQVALDYLLQRGEYSNPDDSPRPCLVLLDLRLPRVDGIEVLKIIKATEELKMIPIVVLTTSAAEKDVMGAYLNHANSYLVKPVGFDQFAQLMDDLGFYWLGWNIAPGL